MGEEVRPDLENRAPRGTVMQTPSRRRQQGLIREALYIFLTIAIVMAVLLDGLALFTVHQDARDDASDAGVAAKQEYTESGNVQLAQEAAATHVEAKGGDMIDFTTSTSGGATSKSFTVTVQHHTDTYLFKYLGYLPGLDDWVDDMQNPKATETTS
jgi:hypothetical protein